MRAYEEINKMFKEMGLSDQNKSKRFPSKREMPRFHRKAAQNPNKEYIFIRLANHSKVIED
ncbi:hypothetical protein THIOM_002552 [Candidatus Thiomargarita nelsonii]|uniref:Uncharacterized protein n=1 Tax=Candidatus Thiomargarita nelsonii TaxID=1003181 RepID=A0A176S110_9GAMM|nr:hypothetical protein THIOM_002552 [Candidatus Thiomargarita nelsonii]